MDMHLSKLPLSLHTCDGMNRGRAERLFLKTARGLTILELFQTGQEACIKKVEASQWDR